MILIRKYGGMGFVEIPFVKNVAEALQYITNTVLIGHYDIWDERKNVSIRKVIVTPECFGLTEDNFNFEGRLSEENEEFEQLLNELFKDIE